MSLKTCANASGSAHSVSRIILFACARMDSYTAETAAKLVITGLRRTVKPEKSFGIRLHRALTEIPQAHLSFLTREESIGRWD